MNQESSPTKKLSEIYLYLFGLVVGLSLIIVNTVIPNLPSLYLWLGIIIILFSFLLLWKRYRLIANQLTQWTQMIRAGDLAAQFKSNPGGEFNKIFTDLQFIGEMLQSQSHDAESQLQKHTTHIARKTLSLSILYDVASSINMSASVDSLLSHFLHTITELIDAQAAAAYLVENETEVEPLTHINTNEEIIKQHATLCLKSSVNYLPKNNFGLLKVNVFSCDEIIQREFFNSQNIRILVIPLQYHGKLLGAYNFYVRENALDDFEDFDELFTSVGRHLGAAIEKSHLDEESTSLSIMRERTHIANELHDSLAQTLTSIRFQVRVLDETLHQGDDAQTWAEMEKIEASINEAHTEIRELIAHFRTPTVLVSLIASVEQTIDRFRQVNDEIQVFFQNEWPDLDLPAETEFHILRIIQESLTNIRKHSDAMNVRIMMQGNANDTCSVLIEDDGVGFIEPQTSNHGGEHIGLSIMRDRAKRFRGQLSVESEPGEGTRIVLEIPTQLTTAMEPSNYELEVTRTHH